MARIGAFDKAILLRTAFDETVHPLGRFDDDLIQRAAAPLTINVHDDIAIGESTTIQKTGELITVVGDNTAGTDDAQVRISMAVVVGDDDTAVEAVVVAVTPLYIAVSDDAPSTDAATLSITMRVVVSDANAATESVTVTLNPLLVSVSDDDSPTEAVTVSLPTQIVIVVADDLTVTEFVNISSGALLVVAVDALTVSERRLVLTTGFDEVSIANERVLTVRMVNERVDA